MSGRIKQRNQEIKRQYELERYHDDDLLDVIDQYDAKTINRWELLTKLREMILMIRPRPVQHGILTYRGDGDFFDLTFYCPYCKHDHTHGFPFSDIEWTNKGLPRVKVEQHRASHCTNQYSPFNSGGYYIDFYTLDELKVILKDVRLTGEVYDILVRIQQKNEGQDS